LVPASCHTGVYDFDTVIDRRGTASLKWDSDPVAADGGRQLLPLWVADMDFAAPWEIVHAIERRASHAIYGYTLEPSSYLEAVVDWAGLRHGWAVQRDWVISSPGVLPSISTALLAFTQPGDGVIIQPPVYYPFAMRITSAGRRVVENPLVERDDRWEMDLEGLEHLIDGRTRALILCSPHNPCSRVWEKDTLARLAAICARHGMLILSDEIHWDLAMRGHRHVPVAVSCPEAAALAVTFVSPTKTFNLAGIAGSFTIIADPGLRARFQEQAHALWMGLANPLSVAAVEAAYRQGARWLDELLAYIGANRDVLADFLRQRLPQVRLAPLQGTYLAWLDMRGLGLRDDEITDRLRRGAGVRLDEGRKFGVGGSGFQRMNLACPRSVLREALERTAAALRTG
jgi:cysteine-S-conjugate beta-lyase